MANGLFIVFEGGEGSGKSTQAELLRQRLTSARHKVIVVREPGTTSLGLHLREYLKSKRPLALKSELLLFIAARAQLISEQIRPSLERGVNVISDRFTGSTVAYQGYGRGIKRDVVDYLNEFVTDELQPDATFFLDIGPDEGLHRVGSPQMRMALSPEDDADPGRLDIEGHRRFEDQPIAFHNRVRRGYLELSESCPNWHRLDANATQDQLADTIWDEVARMLNATGPEHPKDAALLQQ